MPLRCSDSGSRVWAAAFQQSGKERRCRFDLFGFHEFSRGMGLLDRPRSKNDPGQALLSEDSGVRREGCLGWLRGQPQAGQRGLTGPDGYVIGSGIECALSERDGSDFDVMDVVFFEGLGNRAGDILEIFSWQ